MNLFGPYREIVGEKTVRRELPAGATVADLFRGLADDHADLAGRVLADDGEVSNSVTVTKNGRNVKLFHGAETVLEDGDVIRAAPPVHGG